MRGLTILAGILGLSGAGTALAYHPDSYQDRGYGAGYGSGYVQAPTCQPPVVVRPPVCPPPVVVVPPACPPVYRPAPVVVYRYPQYRHPSYRDYGRDRVRFDFRFGGW